MPVTVTEGDAAAVVTLRWPERRNALGHHEAAEVAEAITTAGRSTTAATVVLTGEGAFCAGGDLESFAELSERARDDHDVREHVYGEVQAVTRALRACPLPTIAAVDGPAIGLGLDLSLACDMRFVGESGWLQQGWARAGLIHGVGGVAFLRALDPNLLWSWIASQDRYGPADCARLGLGEDAGASALTAALERAGQLASIDRDVLLAYVELDRPLRWPNEEHMRQSASFQAHFIGSERFRTLAAAILAGR